MSDEFVVLEHNTLIHPNGKEGNVLFSDILNTFLVTVIWRRTNGN